MGLRMSKKIRLFDGVHLNVTQNGISSLSLSKKVGKARATVNINKKLKLKGTGSLLGTGLAYVTKQHDLRGRL